MPLQQISCNASQLIYRPSVHRMLNDMDGGDRLCLRRWAVLMETGVRRVMAFIALLTTSVIMPMSGATSASVYTRNTSPPPTTAPVGTVATSGQVTYGDGFGQWHYAGGSSGSGGGGQYSVGVPAPCWMMAAETGSGSHRT
jgi:hypothetical protein